MFQSDELKNFAKTSFMQAVRRLWSWPAVWHILWLDALLEARQAKTGDKPCGAGYQYDGNTPKPAICTCYMQNLYGMAGVRQGAR